MIIETNLLFTLTLVAITVVGLAIVAIPASLLYFAVAYLCRLMDTHRAGS